MLLIIYVFPGVIADFNWVIPQTWDLGDFNDLS